MEITPTDETPDWSGKKNQTLLDDGADPFVQQIIIRAAENTEFRSSTLSKFFTVSLIKKKRAMQLA